MAASARRVAERAAQLLASPATQRRLSATAQALIDGDGASRVVAGLRTLAARSRALKGAHHAA